MTSITTTFLKGLVSVGAGAAMILSVSAQQPRLDRPQLDRPQLDRPTELEVPRDISKDSQFIEKAAKGNLAEIRFSELAAQRAEHAELKEFAQTLRKEHQQAQTRLRSLAQQHGVRMPMELDEKKQKKLTELRAKTGREFDQEFVKLSLGHHARSVAGYEDALNEVEDQQVQVYAQETLEKLKKHLDRSKELAKAVGLDEATITSVLEEATRAIGAPGEDAEIRREREGIQPQPQLPPRRDDP